MMPFSIIEKDLCLPEGKEGFLFEYSEHPERN